MLSLLLAGQAIEQTVDLLVIWDETLLWCHWHVFGGIIAHVLMMTSSNGNIFRVTGHLCGEFTGHRWIPRTKASDTELWCYLDLCLNNGRVNNGEAGDLRRHSTHYDITVMLTWYCTQHTNFKGKTLVIRTTPISHPNRQAMGVFCFLFHCLFFYLEIRYQFLIKIGHSSCP